MEQIEASKNCLNILAAQTIKPPEFMKNRLVVVTDLGSFKAYKLGRNDFDRKPRLELLAAVEMAEAHDKLTDTVSDLAGRFGRGGLNAGAGIGERHNIAREHRKRLVKQLAERLNRLLVGGEIEGCFFAASKEINHQILARLEPRARSKIEKNIPADLTKLDKSELLERFVTAA